MYSVVSYFCGCGGLDLGFCGGFNYHNKKHKALPFDIVAAYDNPAFKVGGTWRFRQSEIDRWINDQIQAGRKKEVIRTDEQPKSAEHSVSSGRAVRRRRQTE